MDQAKELLSRYTQDYALDEKTRVKAEELYREYLSKTPSHLHSNNENHYHLIMRIAILVASRCQEYKTIDNVTVRGADLSVTQFLRGTPEFSIDDFVFTMNGFIEQVNLDQVVVSDCHLIMKEFNQAKTVFNKFEEIWNKLGIKDKSLHKASADKIRKFVWLFFIISKVRILKRRGDLVESAYVLVAVFITILQLLPEEVTCEFIQSKYKIPCLIFLIDFKRDNQIENVQELKQRFQEYLIQFFKTTIKAQDAEPIILARDTVSEMLIKLKQKGMLKGFDNDIIHSELQFMDMDLECSMPSKCLHNIMSSENLQTNYKKLDQFYQQKLQPTELDDRHFINTDVRNMTPCKLSPFQKYSVIHNKQIPSTPQKQQNGDSNGLEPPNKRILHSSRLLNYDNVNHTKMENAASITLDQKLNEIKFPQRVPNSPYSIKQITPATPISMMMELKNWLSQHLNRVSMIEEHGISRITFNFIHPKNPEQKIQIAKFVSEEIDRNMKKVIELLATRENRQNDQNIKDTFWQMYGQKTKQLTLRILDELLIKEQKQTLQQSNIDTDFSHLLSKDIFLKSVFMCALESVFYINMVKNVQIQDILPLIGLQAFDFWRILNSFLKFDQQMPKSLNDHFRQIEHRIVSEAAWTQGSSVVEIIRKIFEEQKVQSLDQEAKLKQDQVIASYNMFFKRVLHLASQRIIELGDALSLDEEVLEKVWLIMKLLLGHETQLLINRHLDQMVMCTIFCVCKVHPETNVKFGNIISKYASINTDQRNAHNVYMQVLTSNGDKKDIIQFYNEIFIRIMKEYIAFIKPNYQQQQQQQKQQNDLALGSRTPQVNRPQLLTPSLNKPSIKFLCPQSPLKSSLPPPIMQYNTILQQNVRSNHGTPLLPNRFLQSPLQPFMHMTPRTNTLYAFGESATGELDKIQNMFRKTPGQSIGGSGFMQPPPVGGAQNQSGGSSIKNSLIQNIRSKQGGQMQEPQIMPSISRNILPKIGAGLQNSQQSPQIMEPKINIQAPTIMAGIASLTGINTNNVNNQQNNQRKVSDQPMAEPQININNNNLIRSTITQKRESNSEQHNNEQNNQSKNNN